MRWNIELPLRCAVGCNLLRLCAAGLIRLYCYGLEMLGIAYLGRYSVGVMHGVSMSHSMNAGYRSSALCGCKMQEETDMLPHQAGKSNSAKSSGLILRVHQCAEL